MPSGWRLHRKCSLYLLCQVEEVNYFSSNLFWRWLAVDFGEQMDLLEFIYLEDQALLFLAVEIQKESSLNTYLVG